MTDLQRILAAKRLVAEAAALVKGTEPYTVAMTTDWKKWNTRDRQDIFYAKQADEALYNAGFEIEQWLEERAKTVAGSRGGR